MVDGFDFATTYQWNYRPLNPRRPDWFTEWPGGARLAVTIMALHEWESVPRPVRPMPPGAQHDFDYLDYAKRREGVWFCRCIDMASFWLEHERGGASPAVRG